MTEPNDLERERVALIRDRLGALLVEQPGAFETYKTPYQRVTPSMWWSESRKAINNPEMVVVLAKLWPVQPLSGRLASYYAVSVAASVLAEREGERAGLYEGPVDESLFKGKPYAKDLLEYTKKGPESLSNLRALLDDTKQKAAAKLIQVAAAKVRRARRLLSEHADAQLKSMGEIYHPEKIDRESIRLPEREAGLALLKLEALGESLREETFEGLTVPGSAGKWKEFETAVAASLLEHGIPPKRVVQIFSRVGADPESERERILRDVRR